MWGNKRKQKKAAKSSAGSRRPDDLLDDGDTDDPNMMLMDAQVAVVSAVSSSEHQNGGRETGPGWLATTRSVEASTPTQPTSRGVSPMSPGRRYDETVSSRGGGDSAPTNSPSIPSFGRTQSGILRRRGESNNSNNEAPHLNREVTFSADVNGQLGSILPKEFVPSKGDIHSVKIEGLSVAKGGPGRPSVVYGNTTIPTDVLQQVALKRRSKKVDEASKVSTTMPTSPAKSAPSSTLSNLMRKSPTVPDYTNQSGTNSSGNSRSALLYPPASITASAPSGGGLYPSLDISIHSKDAPPKNAVPTNEPHQVEQDEDQTLALQRGVTAPAEGAILSNVDVYYFEVSFGGGSGLHVGLSTSSNSMLLTSNTHELMPGKANNSIGLAQDGTLWVSGQAVEKEKATGGISPTTLSSSSSSSARKSPWTEHPLRVGDVVGCGVEIMGMQRVFFTLNGKLLAPPSTFANLDLPDNTTLPCVAMTSGDVVGNFGLQGDHCPFVWKGSDRLSLIPPTEKLAEVSSGSNQKRFPHGASGTPAIFGSGTPPVFGRKSNKRSNLEDDIPDTDGSSATRIPSGNGPPSMEAMTAALAAATSGNHSEPKPATSSSFPPSSQQSTTSPPAFGLVRGSEGRSNSGSSMGSFRGTAPAPDPVEAANAAAAVDVSREPSGIVTYAKGGSHHNRTSSNDSPYASARESMSSSWGSFETANRDISNPTSSGNPTPSSTPRRNGSQEPSSDVSVVTQNTQTSAEKEVQMLNEALQRSVEKKGSNKVMLVTPQEIEDHKAFARELRTFALEADADIGLLKSLLEVCRNIQSKVTKHLEDAMKYDSSMVDLEELFTLNDFVLFAIDTAEKKVREKEGGSNRPAAEVPSTTTEPDSLAGSHMTAPTPTRQVKRRQTTRSLEIDALVRKKDIFSLICMLRAQSDKRLDSALALMRFAREAERKGDKESIRLRNEIRSSGGIHSLLTLFRTKGTTRELKVIAALAIAYLLPSVVESGSLTSAELCLKVVECLRFLFVQRPISPKGEDIPRSDMIIASTTGLTTFWIHAFYPMLQDLVNTEKLNEKPDGMERKVSVSFRSRSRHLKLRSRNGTLDKRQESMEMQELLEMTVSLIVNMAKLSDDEIWGVSGPPRLQTSDSKMNLRYTLVEQMCAVDVARPIAVREGLLKVLVTWMRSKDREKIRPAATALRDLTSTHDKYMAGWIHSQIVNEGALGEIVELSVSQSVGHDVRLGVAQILSSLCVAPHTRAAVVEAQCINYLIPLLYDHSDPSSRQVAYAAGTALLQLAAGAMTHAGMSKADSSWNDAVSPDKRDNVISDILQGGAIGPFVAMAMSMERNKLRAMSIEALRVISEDTNPSRLTRLQLCEDGAAEAFGSVLKDDVVDVLRILNPNEARTSELRRSMSLTPDDVVRELHQSLCGLANIMDPAELRSSSRSNAQAYAKSRKEEARRTLIRGCIQTAKSGGLSSLLYIANLPLNRDVIPMNVDQIDRSDLLVETGRCLAGLSPLLLSDQASAQGFTPWSGKVLEALDSLLQQSSSGGDEEISDLNYELKIDSLRGINSLARSEPLKTRIIDRSLPQILLAKGFRGDRNDILTAANQVCLSLGFAEDELAIQVAGNDPKLLADWFVLQRSFLIQAMAREELRRQLIRNWRDAIDEAKSNGIFPPQNLGRQSSSASSLTRSNSSEIMQESGIQDFFENLACDGDSAEQRQLLLNQYESVYGHPEVTRSAVDFPDSSSASVGEKDGLLSLHVYPFNDSNTEKDWILAHRDVVRLDVEHEVGLERVQKLLDYCLPSRALQHDIIPMNDLQPQATFDFRALAMPQRRYFSFRREGQLVSRFCDKQAASVETDDVHWTLGFTNSSFAGEFSETLSQVLYRCPMIRGLSFVRNDAWDMIRATENSNVSEDGCALLANLAGSLPPWVSHLTYDNTLNDRAVKALIAILETLGKLSAGHVPLHSEGNRMTFPHGQSHQKQGTFTFFSIRNSPQLSSTVWSSFFKLLGVLEPGRGPGLCPLASLRVLDLSGNDLGDVGCADVLEIIHKRGSGCAIEQLDLSKNNVGDGSQIIGVIRSYIENHRYNQTSGVKMSRKSWRAPLHTLNLSCNNLCRGRLALELLVSMKNNALALKSLDLSDNGLINQGHQFTEVLCATITKNTFLRELNLSGNSFNDQFVDGLISHVNHTEFETGLAFLSLDRNSPALSEGQRQSLSAFLHRSRKITFERFVTESARARENRDNSFIAGRDRSLTELTARDSVSTVDGEDTFNANGLRPSFKPAEKGDNMITVLFSAPLVFHDEQRRLRPFAKLDFAMERDLMWQCLREASRDIELSFDNATHHRLLATMTKRSSCLHYSGHGHPAYLPFENGKGGPHWLQVNELREMVSQEGGAPFKIVFVSACHSGLAGETFASAGVPHVVCCQQESELKDTAALAFTRQFYLALTIGHTVKESFEQGCKAVRATPNLRNPEGEMKKFLLLPRDGNHDVPVFNAKPLREWPKTGSNRSLQSNRPRRGRSLMRARSLYFGGARSSELSVRNMMQDDPSPTPPQDFMGREVDMYKILGSILTKRLVSVVGETGVGRSSIVCALCHYVNERSSTIMEIDQIFYVKTKQVRGERCQKLIRSLLDRLVEAEKAHPPGEGMDLEDLFEAVCKALKSTKALIVFDRTELLEGEDEAQDFPLFLSNLFRETRSVRVLLTARQPLGIPSIGGVVEQPHYLRPLDFANTLRLFAKLSPEFHTPKAREEFFNRLLMCVGSQEQAEVCYNDPNISPTTLTIFSKLGNGLPAGVEKAAYLLRDVGSLGA